MANFTQISRITNTNILLSKLPKALIMLFLQKKCSIKAPPPNSKSSIFMSRCWSAIINEANNCTHYFFLNIWRLFWPFFKTNSFLEDESKNGAILIIWCLYLENLIWLDLMRAKNQILGSSPRLWRAGKWPTPFSIHFQTPKVY